MVITAGYLVENSELISEQIDNRNNNYLYEADMKLEQEWNNFNKLVESYSYLTEANLVDKIKGSKIWEKVTQMWEKIKKWWGDVKAAITRFWNERIKKIFSKKAKEVTITADEAYKKALTAPQEEFDALVRHIEMGGEEKDKEDKEKAAQFLKDFKAKKEAEARDAELAALMEKAMKKTTLYFYDMRVAAPSAHKEYENIWKKYTFHTYVTVGAAETGSVKKVSGTKEAANDNVLKEIDQYVAACKQLTSQVKGGKDGAGKQMMKAGRKDLAMARTIDYGSRKLTAKDSPKTVAKEIFAATDEDKVNSLCKAAEANLDKAVATWDKMFKVAIADQQKMTSDKTGTAPASVSDAVKYFGMDLAFLRKALDGCKSINMVLGQMVAHNLAKLAYIESIWTNALGGNKAA